jgi:hypothetical protein
MFVTTEEIAQKAAALTPGQGEDTETEVDHVDWTALIQVPSVACTGG